MNFAVKNRVTHGRCIGPEAVKAPVIQRQSCSCQWPRNDICISTRRIEAERETERENERECAIITSNIGRDIQRSDVSMVVPKACVMLLLRTHKGDTTNHTLSHYNSPPPRLHLYVSVLSVPSDISHSCGLSHLPTLVIHVVRQSRLACSPPCHCMPLHPSHRSHKRRHEAPVEHTVQ